MKRLNNKFGKASRFFIILLVIVLAAGGAYYYYTVKEGGTINLDFGKVSEKFGKDIIPEKIKEVKKLKWYKDTNTRPYAVMIDNHVGALPHYGINKAYLIYEIPVEGGETRLMALFRDQELDKIGPIRSLRPYFIDYALENNAILIHYGGSDEARSDARKLNVNNIDGFYYKDRKDVDFWRITERYAPHNVLTCTKNIKGMAEGKEYPLTSEDAKKPLIQYLLDDTDLKDGESAIDIDISMSGDNQVTWKYDENKKEYTRTSHGKAEVDDAESDEPYSAKNIICYYAKPTVIAGDEKGIKRLSNLGNSTGYYFTNGKVIPIKTEKDTRGTKTRFYDMEGNQLKINDGRTFIEIVPTGRDISYKGVQPEPETTENAE